MRPCPLDSIRNAHCQPSYFFFPSIVAACILYVVVAEALEYVMEGVSTATLNMNLNTNIVLTHFRAYYQFSRAHYICPKEGLCRSKMVASRAFGPWSLILSLIVLLLVQASPAAAFGAGNIGEL